MKMIGNEIMIRLLSPEDSTVEYVSWLQDSEINQLLEIRWRNFSTEDIQDYIRLMNASENDFLFGIFLKKDNKHIGNIKISEINQIHRFADIGLLIGDKNVWGKGYGTEAIGLVTKYAFDEINLNKVTAGLYANNIGSYKAFIKAGYEKVGTLKNHRFYKGSYIDEILLEKCNNMD